MDFPHFDHTNGLDSSGNFISDAGTLFLEDKPAPPQGAEVSADTVGGLRIFAALYLNGSYAQIATFAKSPDLAAA